MVEVFVLRDPAPTQTRGDWIVKRGRGRGGSILHRKQEKKDAIRLARRAARVSARKGNGQGVTLYVQNASGRRRKESEYNGGHGGGSGDFKLF